MPSGCFEEDSKLDKPQLATQTPEAVKKDDVTETKKDVLKPPPLLPPVEEPDVTLDDIMSKLKKSKKRNQKFEEDTTVLYRYFDKSGKMHVVSHLHMVPTQYRKNVTTIVKSNQQPRDKKGPSVRTKRKSVANEWRKKQQDINTAFKTKYKIAIKEIATLEKALQKARQEEPDCENGEEATIDLTGVTCTQKHLLRIARLEKKLEKARDNLKNIKKDAKKAGVPPGYTR